LDGKTEGDRRTQRTRRALRLAFIALVLADGYERVTAAEICRKANIGRSTFYLHYRTKEQLLEESLEHPSAGLAACATGEITVAQLVPLLEHFREQRRVNRVFFEAPIRSVWVRSLGRVIQRRLPRTRIASSRVPRALAAMMVAELQIGLITNWLTDSPALKPEIVAATLLSSSAAVLGSLASAP
jgi:AcrR family transcriptional regulator